MFTNNYIKFRRMMFLGEQQSFVCTLGETRTNCSAYYSYYGDMGYGIEPQIAAIPTRTTTTSDSSNSNKYKGVYFGSGRTPATRDDYTLESPITSGMTAVSRGHALFKEKDGLYVYEQRFELTNTSDSNITVREMGQIRTVSYYYNSSSTYNYPVLMDRTVLDEPVDFAPGETKLITYRVEFNQTLNVE